MAAIWDFLKTGSETTISIEGTDDISVFIAQQQRQDPDAVSDGAKVMAITNTRLGLSTLVKPMEKPYGALREKL